MRERLVHRGPDDEGELLDGPAALGFRRLSILDLEGGHQPMSTEDGGLSVVYNGEIYNHPELRAELEAGGARFKTRSDTETLLRLYARDGAKAFSKLRGMFAAALWDRQRREFLLVRDPLGIKPVYYRFDGNTLSFSSELRSLMAAGLDDALDPAAVMDYLAYGKVHAPRTIFRDALKLPPATYLKLNESGLKLERYWSMPRPAPARGPAPSLAEAADRLESLLSDSVRSHMLSDVPLGAFLSGGVDSSLIAALMVRHAGASKVRTFSVGFSGAARGVDESAYARAVARHLGTQHRELILPADVLSRLQDSAGLLDEPIADSAILPTFLLAKFAREDVKVALTGEGADELFAGYDRHKAAWVNEGLRKLPRWGRKLAAPLARRLGKGQVFAALPMEDAKDWARATASSTFDEAAALLRPDFAETPHGDALEWLKDFGAFDGLHDALAFDLATVLTDSLLMKVDKSTMRASLEARVPFLDRSVVEYAASLPSSMKIRRFRGKFLLRLVAARHLPKRIAWRRKHGFIVPWESWIRAEKNPVVSELLSDSGLETRGPFLMDRLRLLRSELVRGSPEADSGLFFRVVILGLWLESVHRERAL